MKKVFSLFSNYSEYHQKFKSTSFLLEKLQLTFLTDGSKQYMKLRTNPYVIRIYAGKRKDHIEESYSEMLLFSQWRDEKETFLTMMKIFED